MKIKGFFSEISVANETVEKLKDAGFKGAFVDINDHYIEDRNVTINLAGTRNATSLSDLVIHSGSDNTDRGSSGLTAASPMVSGFGKFEEITNINYTVNVETEENNSNEAKEIIKSMGGELDNPNLSGKKAMLDADIDLQKAISKLNNNNL
ncbi:hypothetical protein CLPU_6c00820 [Gottschalkia purinilytica]|uniref:Uncharacterized protein n=1 Tax=Gottschalkia purinilytica TaxID=1503 RepID=A0A0L0WAS5_GOTPU|nr:hypothetical protein [Gottschalkia purinilytica]KNF08596.1 hypothetical protein CLPU_6c00820 [Gottschalkia purinilytica]